MSGDEEHDFVETTDSLIEDRIVHVLTIWPKINMSMLQVGIGTAISPKMWHPIFNKLLADGKIVRQEFVGKGPTGRDQSYIVVSLVPKA